MNKQTSFQCMSVLLGLLVIALVGLRLAGH
jgi:hypothetical protein